jgi:hypothetical protein
MSVFCSLEEAFSGPVNPGTAGKNKKKRQVKEGFVPGPLSGSPDPEKTVEPVGGLATAPVGHPEAAAQQDMFALPGESAEPEEWSKAFMLEGSQIPQFRADGSSPVDGKSTLWRKVPAPVGSPLGSSAEPTDIHKRLDILTKQLESLTQVKPMQSTAELFLFVAIGLLLLLSVDTLLRFATAIAVASSQKGGRLLNKQWFKRW